MDSSKRQRLDTVGAHLAAADARQSPAAADGGGAGIQLKLLPPAQIREFLAQGFVTLSVLSDLPESWVAEFAARCAEHGEGDGSEADLFKQITPQVNQLLSCPTVAGGLTSLLGRDYLLAAGCARKGALPMTLSNFLS